MLKISYRAKNKYMPVIIQYTMQSKAVYKGVFAMNIGDKAKELTNAVMGTKEYTELKQAKSVIDKNKELRSKIEDFKKKEDALYKGKLSSSEAQKRATELNKIFENLNSIPEVNRFVNAEKSFNDMLQKVYRQVNDTLEASLK